MNTWMWRDAACQKITIKKVKVPTQVALASTQ